MESNADIDITLGRVLVVDEDLTGFGHQVNGKFGRVFGVGVRFLLFQIGDTHVRVTDGFHLENCLT